MNPRLLPRIQPKPPPSHSIGPEIYHQESLALNRLCAPSERGEAVLDFVWRGATPKPHPSSFTEKRANLKLSLGKRKAGGRPVSDNPSKRRRGTQPGSKPPPKPTRLRKNNPVKAQLNIDLWEHIFRWTHPGTLFDIQHATPFFEHVLKYDKLWKSSRENTFGADMPGPPAGMKEQEYCELVTGSGCHLCNTQNVRKVYWAFLKRWCNECYRKNTLREREAKQALQHNPNLLQTIISATRDSWGHYIGAGTVRTTTGLGDGRVPCFSKTDVEQLKRDYEELLQGETPEMTAEEKAERKSVWAEERIKAKDLLVEHLRSIELWQREEDKKKLDKYAGSREERVRFFEAKARQNGVPLEYLYTSETYKRAIKIPKTPSERCWELLYVKLQARL